MDQYRQDRAQFPAYSSPKLDGIRATVTRKGIFTRSGSKVETQPLLRLRLAPHFLLRPKSQLTGELYRHGRPFEDILSATRKGGAKGRLQLHLHPNENVGQKLPLPVLGIRRIKETQAGNQAQLDKLYRRYLAKGYEGQVVRTPGQGALKRKPVQDAEYRIAAVSAGRRAHDSVVLSGPGGRRFKAQSAKGRVSGSDIGKPATVVYSKLTRSGIPRSGVVKSVRTDFASRLPVIAGAAAGTLLGATAGAVTGINAVRGRRLRDGEDISGKVLYRRWPMTPFLHYGVGMRDNRVAHLAPADGKGLRKIAKVVSDPLDKYSRGMPVRVDYRRNDPDLNRVAERAQAEVGRCGKYSLTGSNCEHWVKALHGRNQSGQVTRAAIGGAAGGALGGTAGWLAARAARKLAVRR